MVSEHEDKTCGSWNIATTCSHNLDFGLSRVQLHGLKTPQIAQNVMLEDLWRRLRQRQKSPVER